MRALGFAHRINDCKRGALNKNSLFLPNGISSPSALSFSSKALAPQIPSPMQASQLQPFASSAWTTKKSDLRRPSCSKIAFKVLESPPWRLVHRMWQARCHVPRGNKRCAANPQRLCAASASLHALLAALKNSITFMPQKSTPIQRGDPFAANARKKREGYPLWYPSRR